MNSHRSVVLTVTALAALFVAFPALAIDILPANPAVRAKLEAYLNAGKLNSVLETSMNFPGLNVGSVGVNSVDVDCGGVVYIKANMKVTGKIASLTGEGRNSFTLEIRPGGVSGSIGGDVSIKARDSLTGLSASDTVHFPTISVSGYLAPYPDLSELFDLAGCGQESTNKRPNAINDFFTTNKNVPLTENAMANDRLGDTPTASMLASYPSRGTVMMQSNGLFTYNPVKNFTGIDSFEYSIRDKDGETSTAKVSIRVGGESECADCDCFVCLGIWDPCLCAYVNKYFPVICRPKKPQPRFNETESRDTYSSSPDERAYAHLVSMMNGWKAQHSSSSLEQLNVLPEKIAPATVSGR
jgi:hypothetical protein